MLPVPQKLIRFLPALCIGLYAAVALLAWADDQWQPEWDGAIYLLTAESMARGEGYVYQELPFFLRPPGTSWLLSFFVEPHGFDPHRVNLLLSAFAAAAVATIFLAVRTLHDRWLGLAVALLTGTSAIFTGAFNAVLSEFPFLAFFFGGIALLSHAARRERPGWPTVLAGALCLAAALYLRTVAVVALPGLALVGLRQRALRIHAAVAIALVAGLFTPWVLHSKAAAAQVEVPAEQLFLHDYATALLRVDPGDPGSELVDARGWLARIRKNGQRTVQDLSELVYLGALPATRALFLVLVLVGFVAAFRRGPTLLEWLTPVYLVLVLTYFTYAIRLTAPLAPLVYLYVLLAVREGGRLAARALPVARAAVTVPAAATGVAAGLFFAAHVALLDVPSELGPAQQDQLAIAEWLEQNTPPDAHILCNQAPVYELLSGRRCFTFRFLRKASSLGRYGIDYVLFDQPQEQLIELMRNGPTTRQVIRTGNGSRVPVFRIDR